MFETLTLATAALLLLVGAVASLAGGAIGGMLTGGRALGAQLAAFMGSFYGIVAGVPGLALGLAAIYFLHDYVFLRDIVPIN